MKCSILMAFNDSSSSRAALDFLARMPMRPEQIHITLAHVFRKPTGSEEMMGKKYMQNAPGRIREAMERARRQLVAAGLPEGQIALELIQSPFETVADGILDCYTRGVYDIVLLGRKKKSKAEEFVLGDTSVKLVRALEGAAVLVVK